MDYLNNNILLIDTSSMQALCALAKMDEAGSYYISASKAVTAKSSHSEKLFLTIQQVISDAGILFKDIKAIAYTAGPGSFTGLRIAYSAVQGFVMGTNIKAVGVSSLKALCYNIYDFKTIKAVLITSGKNDLFAYIEDVDGSIILNEGVYGVLDFSNIISNIKNKITCIGSAVSVVKDFISTSTNVKIPENPYLHIINPFGILQQFNLFNHIEGINYLKSSYADKNTGADNATSS